MDILRQELIETQKVRSELIKWKLLLVSALGATGLGFAKSGVKINSEVLLCGIPLVCAYVDIQYANLSLRIMGIATFFREIAPRAGCMQGLIEYEKFVAFAREKTRESYEKLGRHSPQSWLIRASSIIFSGAVTVYGGALLAIRRPIPGVWLILSMLLTGIGGVIFNYWLFHHAHFRRGVLEKAGKEFASMMDETTTDAHDT